MFFRMLQGMLLHWKLNRNTLTFRLCTNRKQGRSVRPTGSPVWPGGTWGKKCQHESCLLLVWGQQVRKTIWKKQQQSTELIFFLCSTTTDWLLTTAAHEKKTSCWRSVDTLEFVPRGADVALAFTHKSTEGSPPPRCIELISVLCKTDNLIAVKRHTIYHNDIFLFPHKDWKIWITEKSCWSVEDMG